jgi:hypothetical protein
MEPALEFLLLELENRLQQGILSQDEAIQWARRLHVFTHKAPSSKRLIWSPDGSGKI